MAWLDARPVVILAFSGCSRYSPCPAPDATSDVVDGVPTHSAWVRFGSLFPISAKATALNALGSLGSAAAPLLLINIEWVATAA